jgi:hypothetical protein
MREGRRDGDDATATLSPEAGGVFEFARGHHENAQARGYVSSDLPFVWVRL